MAVSQFRVELISYKAVIVVSNVFGCAIGHAINPRSGKVQCRTWLGPVETLALVIGSTGIRYYFGS